MHFSRIIVAELIEALDQGKVIPSIVQRNPHYDWDEGYKVAALDAMIAAGREASPESA